MNHESYPNPLEQLALENLTATMHHQAERLGLLMSPVNEPYRAHHFAQTFNRSLQLQPVSDEQLFYRIPALVDSREHGRKRTFYFDVPTYDALCDELSATYEVTNEEVAQLYTGVTLVNHLLEERFTPHDSQKIDQLWTRMRDPSALDQAVLTTHLLSEPERKSLTESLMYIEGDNAVVRINRLRFGLSMLFLEAEEGPLPMDMAQTIESRLTEQFTMGLRSSLAGKSAYIHNRVAMFAHDPEQTKRKYTESIPELALAACFPMSWREVRAILLISKS
ncbi:MAG: hypothetical protein NVS1B7_5170 [Candidatus Saccharimonadales bacterium]